LVAYCSEDVRLDSITLEVSVWKGGNPDPDLCDGELFSGQLGEIYGFTIYDLTSIHVRMDAGT
jgi:hypothetical protein